MLQIFNYNGNNITFNNGDFLMVNATEMAKPFGKQPSDWLKTNQSKQFIEQLSTVRKIVGTELVKVAQGGNNQGTWMHEDVALEFSRWLSPAIAIWCNDRIKELLRHGATAINPESLLDPDYVIRVMTALKAERERSADLANMLEAQNTTIAIQENTIKESASKVQYYNKVLNAQNLIATSVVAFGVGLSANALNKALRARGIIHKVQNTWVLSTAYRDKGYAQPKTFAVTGDDGKTYTVEHLYWTERGREFINRMFQNQTVTHA